MPLIQITLLKGRTTEQKRRIAQRMTDVLVEEAKTAKDGVVVPVIVFRWHQPCVIGLSWDAPIRLRVCDVGCGLGS